MSIELTPPPLVAFCGGKGHGKTTATQVLIEAGYTPVNFADPLKEACKSIYGLTDFEMEDAVVKETPLKRWPFLSPRQIMQHVGTDLFRNWLPETWANAYDIRVTPLLAAGKKVVTSDTRFLNEVPRIKTERNGRRGLLIRINDPRKPLGNDPHPSEVEALSLPQDWTIENERKIEDLRTCVAMLVGV